VATRYEKRAVNLPSDGDPCLYHALVMICKHGLALIVPSGRLSSFDISGHLSSCSRLRETESRIIPSGSASICMPSTL
jgi:hypothetical protein